MGFCIFMLIVFTVFFFYFYIMPKGEAIGRCKRFYGDKELPLRCFYFCHLFVNASFLRFKVWRHTRVKAKYWFRCSFNEMVRIDQYFYVFKIVCTYILYIYIYIVNHVTLYICICIYIYIYIYIYRYINIKKPLCNLKCSILAEK